MKAKIKLFFLTLRYILVDWLVEVCTMKVCVVTVVQRRRKQSRAGGGRGAASRKRAPYFTLANKQKSLINFKKIACLY